jgi:hypothetical protein
MPDVVLKKVIELCAESRFSEISDDSLLSLFDHASDRVRKAAAVKAVRSMPKKRIKARLDAYISRDAHYYNIIHWLDLGASMERRDGRLVARAALE